jgi:hypothetical protein
MLKRLWRLRSWYYIDNGADLAPSDLASEIDLLVPVRYESASAGLPQIYARISFLLIFNLLHSPLPLPTQLMLQLDTTLRHAHPALLACASYHNLPGLRLLATQPFT